jgi:hypothetical protein
LQISENKKFFAEMAEMKMMEEETKIQDEEVEE